MKRLFSSLGLAVVALLAFALAPAFADSSTPANFVNVNFAPINTAVSSNYDWSTGTLSQGTASANVFSATNAIQNIVADPSPPDPNGYGTFIGTAEPVRSPTGGGAVLYESSVCLDGFPTCLGDGSLTYGDMVFYNMRGSTLDELNNLQSEYYGKSGCFGGGSPRFTLLMSDNKAINVYFGTYPDFADCPPPAWTPTGNYASDSAGLRWDSSQICPGTFYNTYSGAVTCADTLGLTINAIFLITDGGWFGTNGGNPDGQQFLFQGIQINQVTRFP